MTFFYSRFTIKKPPEQKKFVIDLNVKTCLEEGKPCEVDEAIFQGTEVPQPMCDMEATMSLKSKNYLPMLPLCIVVKYSKQLKRSKKKQNYRMNVESTKSHETRI